MENVAAMRPFLYITRPFGFLELYTHSSSQLAAAEWQESSDWSERGREREHPYIEHRRSEAPYDEKKNNRKQR